MINNQHLYKPRKDVIFMPAFMVLILWVLYWFEFKFGFNFNSFGIAPQTLKGLRGILFSPFIHGSAKHLYSNTIPLFLLSLALFYFYRKLAYKVLLWGIVISGLLTWLMGQEGSYHIGASGLIYVLASFLFFKGISSKHYRLMALSLIIVFIYGSLVWGVLPGVPGISWEGHLAGFLAGLLLAFSYKNVVIIEKPTYEWEKDNYEEKDDEFMRHFDEDGNFMPSSEMESKAEENHADSTMTEVEFTYIFNVEKDKTEDI
ncbi:rhomboid family intramembrane serine protease [Mesonia aestuariivivens]|uniref:Rhomboid family intramembrane serine protease n=1 Tax=Mesonia aestuariivivens TaxID=2796128 RepID=A0ABS6W347_9FLAO|nr:rhomboid family intramembrane serine protease [Mesonia aestuariivivens]MBW2962229.1 rhomboid family intramembrane serine protease [Mesonia aestuariivivens]